jgi:succinyl-CoA synthetase alpha subunit
MDYGSKVVAGVTPGKAVGMCMVCLFMIGVRQAVSQHPANTSIISVPPAGRKGGSPLKASRLG